MRLRLDTEIHFFAYTLPYLKQYLMLLTEVYLTQRIKLDTEQAQNKGELGKSTENKNKMGNTCYKDFEDS